MLRRVEAFVNCITQEKYRQGFPYSCHRKLIQGSISAPMGLAAGETMRALMGLKEVPEQTDAGTFECPHCQRRRNFRLNYYRNYFHLFGLPIWPWGRIGPLAECVHCHQRYHPRVIKRV